MKPHDLCKNPFLQQLVAGNHIWFDLKIFTVPKEKFGLQQKLKYALLQYNSISHNIWAEVHFGLASC